MVCPRALKEYGSDGRVLYVLLYFGRVALCMLAVADFYHRAGAPLADVRRALDDTHPRPVFAQRVQRVFQNGICGGGVHYLSLSIINGHVSIVDVTVRQSAASLRALMSNIQVCPAILDKVGAWPGSTTAGAKTRSTLGVWMRALARGEPRNPRC